MSNSILQKDLDHTLGALSPQDRSALAGATVLITGAAGFLGYYALQFFGTHAKTLGIQKVIGADNFILGQPDWFGTRRLPGVLQLHKFDIVRDSLADLPGTSDVDFVFHMASIGSSPYFRRHNIETADANVTGLRNLLEFYRTRSLKGLLFFSSSEIYGDPFEQFIPTPETYRGNVPSVGPRACYDESKRFGETLCYLFFHRHGMPVRIVRPFNTYGPGMSVNDRRVPADFAKAVITNTTIEILSDGSPTRTFCYVADALAGYIKVLVHGDFDVFNIGIDRPEISMRRFAEIFRDRGLAEYGHSVEIKLGQSSDPFYLSDVPNRRCPDISKARRILSYAPTIEVEDGIRRYLRFLKLEGVA
jgi:UDP-glucuronate decarboxylase